MVRKRVRCEGGRGEGKRREGRGYLLCDGEGLEINSFFSFFPFYFFRWSSYERERGCGCRFLD